MMLSNPIATKEKIIFGSYSVRILIYAIFVLALTSVFQEGLAQISITTTGNYTQNFNGLPATGSATWTNNSTIPNWYHARTGTGSFIEVNDGSSNAGNLYSYGTGTDVDRALGSLGSGNASVGNLFWGVKFINNTGAVLNSISVAYTGEQWRNSAAAAQTISFSYLVGTPTVTGTLAEFQAAGVAVPFLDFTSPVTGGTAGALNGNLAANRQTLTFTITGMNVPNGSEFMLRWSDPDHTGADHGLSIDDLVIAWTISASTPSMGPEAVVNNNNGATPTSHFTQSETSVVAFGNNVIVGFNDAGSNAGSANKFTGYAYSTDGGVTFTDGGTLATNAGGDAGNPVLVRNSSTGRIYFSTLGFSVTTIQIFRSDDNGVSWLPPVNGTPGGNSEDFAKIAIDNYAGTGNGNVYVVSRRFGGAQGIYFFRSTDHGNVFLPNGGTLIVNAATPVQGAYVVVGPDHSVYVFWLAGTPTTGSIMMRRSTDQGVTFGAPVTVVSGLTPPGINGDLGLTGIRQGTATPAPFRSNSFPRAVVNPVSGHVYVTFNDNPAGVDKADIYLVTSTDNGATWSPRVLVNDDGTTTDQWNPNIAITPDGSSLGIFYYSREEDPANNLFKYRGRTAAISGGTLSILPSFPISTVASFPEFGRDAVVNTVYMGSYDVAVTADGKYHVTWSDNRDDYTSGPPRKDPNIYYRNILALLSGPNILVAPNPVNFGNVELTETGNVTVTITNIGDAPLTVTSISSPGGEFSLTLPSLPAVIPSAGNITLTAHFSPTSVGVQNSFFQITSNAMNNPVLTVTLTGTGITNIATTSSTIISESCTPANSAVDPDETVTVSLCLENTGISNTSNLVATLQATGGVISTSSPQTYGVVIAGGAPVCRNFTFTASGVCGNILTATLQLQDGANNLGTVTYTFILGATGSPVNYSTGNIAVAIPDNGSVDIPLVITDVNSIADINVKFRLNHTFDGDLEIKLVHPDNTEVLLVNNRGGSGDNFGTGNNDCSGTPTVIDDQAVTAISAGVAPFAGSFRPENPLSVLNTKPTNGTWLLRISDQASLDVGTVGCFQLDITGYNCCTAGSATIPLVISEFRLRGTAGENDEYIEIYNTNNTPYTIASVSGTGLGVAASDGLTRAFIPNGTVIPAHGHYLITGPAYSLANYGGTGAAAGNTSYVTGIPDNAGIALFNNNIGGASYSLANRIDAVGSSSEADIIYKEGTGYAPLSATAFEYCFRRKTYSGPPQDTHDNAADFEYDETTGTINNGNHQRLGAPGPENLTSPVSRSATVVISRLDQTVGSLASPNMVVTLTPGPPPSALGTLDLRYRITNNTGVPITRLRLRIDSISTLPAGSGIADLRPITSSSLVGVGPVMDPGTCASTTPPTSPPCSVNIEGTTLDQPPVQSIGGGFNSSLSVSTISTANPLANGASINVRLVFGIQQTGTFNIAFTPEILPGTAVTGPVPVPEKLTGTIASPCTLTCPSNITVNNDPNQCGAIVNFTPTTTGSCGTVTATPASGSFFPVGTTTVTVTSSAGPTCTFTVTVNDTQAPTATCPANITVSNDPNQCGAIVNFTPTVSDNCPGVTFNSVPASGSFFPIGTTTVTSTATDANGNTATCTFTVTVTDTQPPSITCPAPVTVSCSSNVPAPNPASVTAADNCPGVTVAFVNDVVSGQTCPNRFTITRTYRATDLAGNTATCTQTITVNDQTAPTITCPAPLTVGCASQVPVPNIASVTGVSDNCGGVVTVTHQGDVISGQTCPNRYTITRTYRATDVCGNFSECSQIITVNDQTPPTLTCPAAVTVSCASQVPAPNIGSVTGVSDNCGGVVTVTHQGDVITNQTCPNRYTITRTYRATDVCGNFAECTQTITVNDQTPPTLTCPANVTVSCASQVPAPNIASVTGVSDNCGGVVTVTHQGDVITNQTCPNRYTITRTYRATDVCGNFAQCTQTIIVNDQTPPVITCPSNITVSTPIGSCTAVVTYTVTATDNCAGAVTIVSNPASGSTFQIGTTTVTATATDVCGNTSSCTFTVTVLDAQIPVISAHPQTRNICTGEDATFSITAAPANGPNNLTYQWQIWNGTAWVNVAGATGTTLNVNDVNISMNHTSYRVLVIGLCTTVASNPATLNVIPLPTVSITPSTPAPVVRPGESITFTAVVNPSGGTVQWSFNGIPIAGATSLVLANRNVNHIGTHTVNYTDLNGCVQSASIELIGEPSEKLFVYPSPTSGIFHVRFNNTSGQQVRLNVFDSKGSLVYRQEITTGAVTYHDIRVNLSTAESGTYILEIVDAGGTRIGTGHVVIHH